jgi:hypothetical protein
VPDVLEVHHVAGQDSYLAKVRVKDPEALGRLLRERFGAIPSVRSTMSTIALETLKEHWSLPIEPLPRAREGTPPCLSTRRASARSRCSRSRASGSCGGARSSRSAGPSRGSRRFLMCGLRLLSAGGALLLWARLTGVTWPRGIEWRNAALVGVLLPGVGNVSVTIGVAHVPSGLVALLVSTIPLWMALLVVVRTRRPAAGPAGAPRPGAGFSGIALLIGPGLVGGHDAVLSPLWALVPVAGSLSWSWGSLWSRRARLPRSPLMSTGVGLVAAGLGSLLFALARATSTSGTPPPRRRPRGPRSPTWRRSARCSASAPTSTCCGATRRRSWPRTRS